VRLSILMEVWPDYASTVAILWWLGSRRPT
jgi:hypothetical protein